jgi:pyruvate formate lyase activating enzyme
VRAPLTGLAGWTKNSFIDYPATVATVLFFGGCNLRCPYCHNPAIVDAETGIADQSEEIWQFLEERKALIQGVVFSGGEPTIHAGIAERADEMRHRGYRIKLDTNGLLPEAIQRIAPDYLAVDLKTDPEKYATLLRAPYRDVKQRLSDSLDSVRRMGDAAEVRITVAPGIIDSQDIDALLPLLKGVAKVFLQQPNPRAKMLDPTFKIDAPPSRADLEAMRTRIAAVVGGCVVRGIG